MKVDYKTEFPRYDDELPTLKGFEDSSWHNDACPSLMRHIDDAGTFIQIFCDYKDQAESDFADLDGDAYRRFSIMLANAQSDWSIALYESNSWEDIKDYLERFNIGGYSL
jgi:hypothetical protein